MQCCYDSLYFYIVFFFLFFKQKTAYEMRISDWSSDVCSSDLHGRPDRYAATLPGLAREIALEARALPEAALCVRQPAFGGEQPSAARLEPIERTETRRVREEWVRTGRTGWEEENKKKQKED